MSIVISHGDKGGVGKSLLTCAAIDYRANQKGFDASKVIILDADPRNADVFRMFDGYPQYGKAERISLASKEDWMKFIDRIQYEKGRGYDYMLSLPAGIGGILGKEGAKFGDLVGQLGHQITMFWTIDRMPDSINLFKRALFDIGGQIKYKVLVKNLFFGEADSFSRWDKSFLRKLFLHQDGIEANLPELHEWVIDQVIGDQLGEADVKKILLELRVISASEAENSGERRTVPFSELLKRTDLRLTLRVEMEEWLYKVGMFFKEIDLQIAIINRDQESNKVKKEGSSIW